ncbi:MAG: matrixin family metalloprotease [Moraxellaceae bacterium]|nr:MAG: matrixin family metalloprotease [Moraxellaceae bacterium]
MRSWLPVLLVVVVLVYGYQAGQSQRRHTSLGQQLAHPFDTRVHYRIGEVDPQFNLPKSDITELARQAAEIWHQGTGQDLFVYDPAAFLSINLRFDERQLESNLRHAQQQQLQQQLSSQQSNNGEYQQRQMQLHQQRQQLDLRERAFKERLASYNRTVQDWNTLGNLDAFNRQQLAQQQRLLDAERQDISRTIDHYNEQVSALNQVANSLNQMADHYNQAVNRYQARFVPREFEKGVYDGREINIYEFSTPADLRLTIAHELGHALGLKHNNDPYALMYPVLQQQNVENFHLTVADKTLLSAQNQ